MARDLQFGLHALWRDQCRQRRRSPRIGRTGARAQPDHPAAGRDLPRTGRLAMRLTGGTSSRLGATWDGRGTNFALFSANAEKVELCLFDSHGRREIERIALPERTEDVWHGDLSFDRRDNARGVPKSVVVDEAFTWGEERRPSIPWEDTIIYEAHVKGLTQLRDDVPPAWRGTYRGLTAPAVVNHLKRLGVTAR